ncbi:Lrp/AsnC family transcriptional regulator [Bradyrhizobium japonicum]|uniref:Lrp/AsnC family transcriptional regulator n=1 Tax=Bradyrhizobium japonicum TaxID=375 RepID=UPI001BA4A532|nr:Lrp/AsnC family transcriptional regulator [Bradyrhizobium japonicum]MBR0766526.1 Lrp/AsnC family transcriptional regulator [Bradyrhizobium japonicum]
MILQKPAEIRDDLDSFERRILRHVQKDSSLPITALSEAVGMSPSPCHRRLKALEERGIIKGYVAIVDRMAVGQGFTAFAQVSLERQTRESVDAFESQVAPREEILEAHLVSGDYDYLLKIVARDISGFQEFLWSFLTKVPQVAKIRTLLPMRTVKESIFCPIH